MVHRFYHRLYIQVHSHLCLSQFIHSHARYLGCLQKSLPFANWNQLANRTLIFANGHRLRMSRNICFWYTVLQYTGLKYTGSRYTGLNIQACDIQVCKYRFKIQAQKVQAQNINTFAMQSRAWVATYLGVVKVSSFQNSENESICNVSRVSLCLLEPHENWRS